ncbi:hypothetical protein [Kamptonema sp. UHCC 0994]
MTNYQLPITNYQIY